MNNPTAAIADQRRPTNHVAGYKGLIVRDDLKSALTERRNRLGWGRQIHMERCLASACLEYALAKLSDEELLQLAAAAVSKDVLAQGVRR